MPAKLPEPVDLVDLRLPSGASVTFNPDDDRWYVHAPGETAVACATFAERRNARHYARKHFGN